MRVLFLPVINIEKKLGSSAYVKSLERALSSAYGQNCVDVISVSSQYEWSGTKVRTQRKYNWFAKIINILLGYTIFWGPADTKTVIDQLKKEKYDLVFFGKPDSGLFPKKLKRLFPNLLIATFIPDNYPQILFDYKEKRKKLDLKGKIYIKNLAKSEKSALCVSDINFVFNTRESDSMVRWFGIKPNGIIPMFLEDKYDPAFKKNNNDYFLILFVGAFITVNIEGVLWFYNQVFKNLDQTFKLLIVGNEMEKMNRLIEDERVIVRGRVDSLTDYYQNADIVVGPIFSGTGMKTKTAEALMYKKIILGTEECFEGYEGIPDSWRCNDAEAFISKIKLFSSIDRTSDELLARSLFENKYSCQAVSVRLRQIIDEKKRSN